MRIDYSEKKTVQKGLERKPVQKNRPRKDSSGMFALLSVAALLVTFCAGVGTGWILFKGPRKGAAPAAVVQPLKKDEPAQAGQQQKPTTPPPDAPLTFYKTLPAGGKGVIGSGMNLKKQEPATPAHPAPAPVHAAPASAPESPAAAAPAPAQEQKQQPAAQFVVQIASYRSKQEADAAQSKLTSKGMAAYVVELRTPDKGVWYRLRAGKHLTKAEAEELAGKAGKGAIVLPE
jgi:septal ring-binding cell division protein DamX